MIEFKVSEKAKKRVTNYLPVPTYCTCCHDFKTGECSTDCIERINNSEIYGKEYGKWPFAYRCTICGAYVGLHPFTDIPLGTLADASLRKARKECKEPFEALHKKGLLSRSEAYKRLAEKLKISISDCHFGWFDIEMCQKASVAAREIFISQQVKVK